jgi:hypothetical protein
MRWEREYNEDRPHLALKAPRVTSSVFYLIARQAQAVVAENHLHLSLSAQLLFCSRHHVARIEAEPLLQLFEGR